MQVPRVLVHFETDQPASLVPPDLDKVRIESEDVVLAPQRKGVGCALPRYLPAATISPAVLVDEKRKLGITEQEFGALVFDEDWLGIETALDEWVERRVGVVEQRLRFERFEGDDFKPFGAGNAELGFEKVYRIRLHWNVEFLEWPQYVLAAGKTLGKARLLLTLGARIDRFVDLDCARQRRRLDATDQILAIAGSSIEVRRMANLAAALSGHDAVLLVDVIRQCEGPKRLVGEHKKHVLALHKRNLCDELEIEEPSRPVSRISRFTIDNENALVSPNRELRV